MTKFTETMLVLAVTLLSIYAIIVHYPDAKDGLRELRSDVMELHNDT